ncbi:MAG: DNA-binding transcriptional regulator [Planctomycetes bacterium]|nr:DNA-binding transcriptional regulator [Planctomycetota bacterium]
MRKRPRVALLIETSTSFGRGLLKGIGEYLRPRSGWSMFLQERSFEDPFPGWIRSWRGEGIITRLKHGPHAQELLSLGLPIVDVRYQEPDLGLPAVHADQYAAGRLAAQHYLDRGFRHFAWYGPEPYNWAEHRRKGYVEVIHEKNLSCLGFPGRWADLAGPGWEEVVAELCGWIKNLPRPIAIFTSHDIRGLEVLEACRRLDLAVPEQVSVLGVDDDEILCNLGEPPLSSINTNIERIGYEAAALLDRMMNGEPRPHAPLLVAPLGVTLRASTDTTAIDDEAVARACRYIREHACEGIDVDQVVQQTGLSRRALERRFQRWLKRTPKSEIHRVQIQRVKDLLLHTTCKLAEIAAITGFQHVEYMSFLFKKKTGQTPGQYRRLKERPQHGSMPEPEPEPDPDTSAYEATIGEDD